MKRLFLLCTSLAVAFCAVALSPIVPASFAQEVATAVSPHDLVTRSITPDLIIALIALAVVVALVVFRELVMRADLERQGIDDGSRFYFWPTHDLGRSSPS